MPIPVNAKPFAQPLDPSDVLDFYAVLAVGEAGDNPTPLLLTGEGVGAFTLAPTVEAVAAGLKIMKAADGYPAPVIGTDNVLVFWLSGANADPASSIFSGSGTALGIELTVHTNNNPPRVKQRTLVVTVQNQ